MAEARGLTQVHVNRVVQQLRLRCAVEIRNMRLEIPDFAQLAALASFNATYLHLGEPAMLVDRARMLFLTDLGGLVRPTDGALSSSTCPGSNHSTAAPGIDEARQRAKEGKS